MKRPTVILILLMLTSTFTSCATASEPGYIPHEDPTGTQGTSIDAYYFLTQYASIFALLADKKFENASQLTQDVSRIKLPEDIIFILNRYNNLTQQLISTLNQLQNTLDNASALLDQNRLNEAERALNQAGILVLQARNYLGDLKDATTTVSKRLGIWAAPADSDILQAYNRLESMLQRLNDLIDRYYELLKQAKQRAKEIATENLSATELTLNLSVTECFVGETVTALGILTANGNGLGNQEVKLFLDNNETATAKTDSNGAYSTAIKIPYKYVEHVLINAKYTPEGSNKDAYLASTSPTVRLRVLFYVTVLEIDVPKEAYPGAPLTLQGNVTTENGPPLNPRQVQIRLDGSNQSEVQTNDAGRFTSQFIIDARVEVGNHNLTVNVDPEGVYTGANGLFTLNITKKATDLQVETPTFIFLPTQIQVSGTAHVQDKPLNNAKIIVDFLNISKTTRTNTDGTFNITLDIPVDTVLGGYQTLEVEVQPAQPWQAPEQNQTGVFALNIVSICVALASSIAVGVGAYLKFSKTKQNNKPQTVIKEQISQTPEKAPAIFEPVSFEGIKGQILKAYLEAQKAVQQATKLTLESNMTLREYAHLISAKIGEAAAGFFELTSLAEKSLYSPHEPQIEDAEKAEDSASNIRRFLSEGS
ncbi:MAG: hypothetical protein NWE92_09155 [Candidatus Bathyarchaeota archaeon]|nr:hypothetical protein [Candidatus Bathyarchaeota archaeon]